MRLQVEIATASWTSAAPRRSRRNSAARASGSARRSRTSTGAVLCETPIASSSLTPTVLPARRSALVGRRLGRARARPRARGAARPSSPLGCARSRRGHDRDVDEHQRHEHDVGAGHVLAGRVQRQRRGGERRATLMTAPRSVPAAGPRRRRAAPAQRAQLHPGALGAPSRTSTGSTNSSAIPTSETKNVSRIEPGRLPPLERQHARVDELLGEPDGDEVERHERAGDDREHARVAGLALGVLDREAQRLVGGEQQHHDQEGDERRLVPHPPVAPRRLGPDRAGDQRRRPRRSATCGSPRRSACPSCGRRCAGGRSRTRRRRRTRTARRSPAARGGRRSSG